jgi:hypothetical protein
MVKKGEESVSVLEHSTGVVKWKPWNHEKSSQIRLRKLLLIKITMKFIQRHLPLCNFDQLPFLKDKKLA